MILSRWLSPRPNDVATLYGEIVAAARQPQFYRDWAIPDTIDGRFDMLVLHLAMVIARLKDVDQETRQKLIDQFCVDMDDNLREQGASDVSVGKKVRHMAEAFQGRYVAYESAIDKTQLAEAINRNTYAGKPSPHAVNIANYVEKARLSLAAQSHSDIAAGKVRFV